MIHDRSTQGARLRMDDAQSMPETMLLFEDSTETLIGAALVWRSRTELGIRFTSSPVGEEMRRIEHKLSGRYYAV